MLARPLHEHFAAEVLEVDLQSADIVNLYPRIRTLFERHSLLLFRDQDLDEARHRAWATCFGPLEDLRDAPAGRPPERPVISNVAKSGTLVNQEALLRLDIEANFLWHTDSSFLPGPSISNILVACQLPASGGETEFVSTRAGWAGLPQRLQEEAQGLVLLHRFSHSRSLVDPRLGALETYTRFPDTAWRATWRNPLNGSHSLYIGAHACAVLGMQEAAGKALIDELTEAVTQPQAIYRHCWRPGDVLLWDQRAILHRGRPWPYEEERTLASFVSSAREADGIASARP